MNIPRLLACVTACLLAALPVAAQVPGMINYQGRVAVGSVNFDGTDKFKFGLVSTRNSVKATEPLGAPAEPTRD